MAYDPLSSIQAGGLLGSGQPASPGLLGGMFSGFNPQAFSQGMVDNQGALMGLASGILGGVNMRQGLAQGLQNFQQGRQADFVRNKTATQQKALEAYAKSQGTLTPQMQAYLATSPELANMSIAQTLTNPNGQKMSDLELKQKEFEVAHQGQRIPKLMEIGTNPDGSKRYGFVDEVSQKVIPYDPPGGGGSGPFNASSVDGQSLNILSRTGKYTPEQLATFAASKVSQSPLDNAITMIGPGAIPQQGGGTPQQQGAPGVVAVTPGKPGGNLTEQQQRAKMFATNAEKEAAILDKTWPELSNLGNQTKGAIPGVGNFMVTPGYQRARNSLKEIIKAQVYVASGAQVPPAELEAEADGLMPRPGDDPPTIADKQARIKSKIDAIRGIAGMGAAPQSPQSTGGDWYDAGGGVKIRPKGP